MTNPNLPSVESYPFGPIQKWENEAKSIGTHGSRITENVAIPQKILEAMLQAKRNPTDKR